MDQLLTKEIDGRKGALGLLLLLMGFLNLSFGWLAVLSPYSLAITGLLAFYLTFGKDMILLIKRPIQPIKYFFLFFPLSVVVSLGISYLLIVGLGLQLSANPITGHVPWLQLPFMLLGEELISFFIFLLAAIKLQRLSHQLLAANLISAVCFAAIHILTYWNGNLLLTIFHVLALQGVTRIIFNEAGIKSNTLLVPWIIHLLFDALTLLL